MTSLAAPHATAPRATARTSTRTPLSHSFASACAAVGRGFRILGTAVELERRRPIDDPYVLLALLRG